ncbi:uncharacterized protein CELE_T12B5.15 [Caenorhabditis elegans]|uniref:Secreted protein n=1 Tax=Caenorhabditis elegans TaxID=6239 RepID=A8WJ47_CAEEL|nr:Secreted protein [Caenorhabditis elegans]CCD73263.1 Secreted protein [Caenorhabditis elegans]|eukprot:NP_001122720.1 Uncharacterized protein CELE_T12B5.15 [Caenorhabditis elegans]
MKILILAIFFAIFISGSALGCARETCSDDSECESNELCGFRGQEGKKFCQPKCSSDADCSKLRRCDIDRCAYRKDPHY